MNDYLVFQLYGPLQSWGEIAVGQVRGSADHPGRSAVAGLLAACLGLDRDDPRCLTLAGALRLAVRVDRPGLPLIDYHTAQCPARKAKRRFFTRKDELGGLLAVGERPNTVLSDRSYRQDACCTVCVWLRGESPCGLEELKAALLRPRFTPYLGRKSCPPGLPFAPALGSFAAPEEALAAYPVSALILVGLKRDQGAGTALHRDEDGDAACGQVYTRRDVPVSRKGQFRFHNRRELALDTAAAKAREDRCS